jgi:hypothetical protein
VRSCHSSSMTDSGHPTIPYLLQSIKPVALNIRKFIKIMLPATYCFPTEHASSLGINNWMGNIMAKCADDVNRQQKSTLEKCQVTASGMEYGWCKSLLVMLMQPGSEERRKAGPEWHQGPWMRGCGQRGEVGAGGSVQTPITTSTASAMWQGLRRQCLASTPH